MSEQNQITSCEIIRDLLPLYHDEICSDDSKQVVEEHLKTCEECKRIDDQLNDTYLDDTLKEEKNDILGKYAKKQNRRAMTIGIVMASVLMVPMLVCLVANLATHSTLDWFFIVLASLLVVSSFLVVPFVVTTNRFLWVLGSFTGSLIILFFVANLYVGGDWFILTTASTILGLSVIFMPYIIRKIPLPEILSDKKIVLVISWDTIWLCIVIALGIMQAR